MALMKRDITVFFSVTLAFLIGTMHLVIRLNIGRSETLGKGFLVLLVCYLIFVTAWTIGLIRKFSVKKAGST